MARTVRMSARSCECAAIGFEHAPPSNDQFRCLIRNVRFRASPSRGKICMCVTGRPSKQAIFVGARSGFIAAGAGAIRTARIRAVRARDDTGPVVPSLMRTPVEHHITSKKVI